MASQRMMGSSQTTSHTVLLVHAVSCETTHSDTSQKEATGSVLTANYDSNIESGRSADLLLRGGCLLRLGSGSLLGCSSLFGGGLLLGRCLRHTESHVRLTTDVEMHHLCVHCTACTDSSKRSTEPLLLT